MPRLTPEGRRDQAQRQTSSPTRPGSTLTPGWVAVCKDGGCCSCDGSIHWFEQDSVRSGQRRLFHPRPRQTAGTLRVATTCASRIMGAKVRRDKPAWDRNERVRHRRPSEPRWPRVMREFSQEGWRSVDRGKCRQGIEPRNRLGLGCRHYLRSWKATRPVALSQVTGRPRVVEDPWHARTLHAREPGDPLVARSDGAAGRKGKATAVIQ
jgi:hypothetical protein